MSASEINLYTVVGTWRAGQILSTVHATGVEANILNVDHDYPHTEEFKKNVNPTGFTPILITQEGTITEETAIMRYLANISGKLYGENDYEKGLIDQWLEFYSNDMTVLLPNFDYQRVGLFLPDIKV